MRNILVIIIWFVKRQTSAALTQGSCMFNAQQGTSTMATASQGDSVSFMFVLKLTGRVQHQVHSLVSTDLAFQNCRSYPGVLGYTHTLTHSRAINLLKITKRNKSRDDHNVTFIQLSTFVSLNCIYCM